MRKSPFVFLLGIIAILLMTAGSSFACGGLFCQNVPVAQQSERIIFTMNADDTITAYVQINFTGDAPDFSWVVPVPTVPEVDVAEMDTFDELDSLTQPIIMPPPMPDCVFQNQGRLFSSGLAYMAVPTMELAFEVQVLASGTAGPYGFDVVDSPDPDALIEWLRENDYQVTEEMEPLIHVYNEEGMPFLAMKLQPEAGAQDIQPVALTYESEFPMIPIRLTAVAATPNMNILTWIFADEQSYPENFEQVTIQDKAIRGNRFTAPSNNYMQLLDAAIDAENGLAMTTEYAQPTSELENLQITDPLLLELTQNYAYVTRFLGRMSPEEMILDPIFAFDGNRGNISNIRNLTNHNAAVYWDCDLIYRPSFQYAFGGGIALALFLLIFGAYRFGRGRRTKEKNS